MSIFHGDDAGMMKISVSVIIFLLRIVSRFIPSNLHALILSPETQCYIDGLIPFSGPASINLALLDSLDWGYLPANELWSILLEYRNVQGLLLRHCHELEYHQVLWIAKNDPTHSKLLLSNHYCMAKINWTGLDFPSYTSYFGQLPVYSILKFPQYSTDVLRHGLRSLNYRFPSLSIHFDFLKELYRSDSVDIFHFERDLHSANLIDANFFMYNNSVYTADLLKTVRFLNSPKRFGQNQDISASSELIIAKTLAIIKLNDMKDFINSFHQSIWPKDDAHFSITSLNDLPSDWMSYFKNDILRLHSIQISINLLNRNWKFFLQQKQLVFSCWNVQRPGRFDQWRLIISLLNGMQPEKSSHLQAVKSVFLEYLSNDFISCFVLRKFLHESSLLPSHSSILTNMLYESPKIVLAYAVKDESYFDSVFASPLLLTQLDEEAVEINSLVTEVRKILKHSGSFVLPSFRIKFENDAVIDMGGPLLDWINSAMTAMIRLKILIPFENEEISVFYPSPLISPRWLQVLGLFHGKLLQMNCRLSWKLVRPSSIKTAPLSYIKDILSLESTSMALDLFNNLQLPRQFNPAISLLTLPDFSNYPGGQAIVANCMENVQSYHDDLIKTLQSWEGAAFHQYEIALKSFLFENVDDAVIEFLLEPEPEASFTASSIAQIFSFTPGQDLAQIKNDLDTSFEHIWLEVLEHLNANDLKKLLVFATGQPSLQFDSLKILTDIITTEEAHRRLPRVSTCTNQFFIYIQKHYSNDVDLLVAELANTLLYAIHNCKGFGLA